MNSTNLLFIFTCTLAYLLGSIPFGLILTRQAGLGDIRSIGSGNIGATNVLRTGNKKIAALTLLLDGLKGTAAVLITRLVFHAQLNSIIHWDIAHGILPIYPAAFAVLLGHVFPVWLKFKGGKGVITTLGAALGLAWPVGVAGILVWLVTFKVFRVSSVAGMTSIALLPLCAVFFGRIDPYGLALLLALMAALVLWKHRDNIKRLINGTELKIGRNKNATPPA